MSFRISFVSFVPPGGHRGVEEYYQQQDEMLEGFTEMDSISDGRFLGTSKVVSCDSWFPLFFGLPGSLCSITTQN